MRDDAQANVLADIGEQLLQYVHISKDYERTMHSYGLDEKFGLDIQLNHMEIHILSTINTHPGISAQDLASMFGRSKGSISQILKVLTKHGLMIKQENPTNARINNLYTTAIGQSACENHHQHEMEAFHTLQAEFQDYTAEDFAKVEKLVKVFSEYFKTKIE